jgi:hypothetical protein
VRRASQLGDFRFRLPLLQKASPALLAPMPVRKPRPLYHASAAMIGGGGGRRRRGQMPTHQPVGRHRCVPGRRHGRRRRQPRGLPLRSQGNLPPPSRPPPDTISYRLSAVSWKTGSFSLFRYEALRRATTFCVEVGAARRDPSSGFVPQPPSPHGRRGTSRVAAGPQSLRAGCTRTATLQFNNTNIVPRTVALTGTGD